MRLEGRPVGESGSTKGPQLVVSDIDAASRSRRCSSWPRGAPGSRFAFFAAPDGNGWSVQDIRRS